MFKVGDKVVAIVSVGIHVKKGDVGFVTAVSPTERYNVRVDINDMIQFPFYEKEITHVKIKSTKISRAFYKGRYEEDGNCIRIIK